MKLKLTPLTESFGTLVESRASDNIFDVKQEDIVSWFKSSSLLLLRGFAVDTEKFKEFSSLFSTDFISYVGGAYSRQAIAGDKTLLSVTGGKLTFAVPFHGEMYYKQHKPEMMWFYCAMPPVKDGQTTICDGIEVYNQLSPATKELFNSQKIKYLRTYQDGAWQQIYQTDNLSTVEQVCRENNLSLQVNPDNSLTTEYICSAIVESRSGKDQVFINNILPVVAQEKQGQKASIVRFEDNSQIPDEVIQEIQEVTEKLTYLINWQTGDIAMLDNRRLLHGRKAFADTQREIYVRLNNPAFSW